MRSNITAGRFGAILIGIIALGSASQGAKAQFGFFGFGGSMRRLGGPTVINATGYDVPYFQVSPRGVQGGYIGPDGPYSQPADSRTAYAYPNNSQIGSLGSGSIVAPFSGPATDPSKADASGQTSDATKSDQFAGKAIPRTSDTFEAKIEKDNNLFIKWSGEPRMVSSITFALLDKDRKPIKQEKITKLPTQARLSITSKTSYYQVFVEYVNGTTTNVISPL